MWAVQSDELFATLDELKAEGKIRAYGAALGPAIGWEPEGLAVIRDRDIATLQIIHNMLEQDPGRSLLAAAEERGVGVLVRVPHSSGLLEGKYTAETTFPANDHRSHRPREWLIEGLQKLEKLTFLTEGTGRTIGQAAIQWLLASPDDRLGPPEHLRRRVSSPSSSPRPIRLRSPATNSRGSPISTNATSISQTSTAPVIGTPLTSRGHSYGRTRRHPESKGRRQVVKFSFYRVDPAWRGLSPRPARTRQARASCATLEAFSEQAPDTRLQRRRHARRRRFPALADRRHRWTTSSSLRRPSTAPRSGHIYRCHTPISR